MPTPQIAGHIRRSLLDALTYQCAVNRLVIARGLRVHGHGGLLTPVEMRALDVAFQDGTPPEQFVDQIAASAPRIAEAS